VFYVLSGEVKVLVGEEEFIAGPGSTVYLPRGLAHVPIVTSESSENLLLTTPGDFANFFNGLSIPATGDGLPRFDQVEMPRLEDLLQTGTQYGITFLPPGASVGSWPIPEIHATPRHLSAGAGQKLDILGSRVTIKLEGSDTQNLFSMFEIEDPAGMSGPTHIHHADSEAFFVLEGAYEFTIGDRIERATTGSFVYIPKHLPRRRRNYANTTGRLLAITATSGHENFYREIAEMKTFDSARLQVAANRFGIEIL
jgi:mannose-6-phosphate isomerase-like protein (cupin superfamily)